MHKVHCGSLVHVQPHVLQGRIILASFIAQAAGGGPPLQALTLSSSTCFTEQDSALKSPHLASSMR
jgi:hypothetical protein